MARRRTVGTTDLRAHYLERLLASHRYRRRPQDVAVHLAKVRDGEPFMARGWQLDLRPTDSDFWVEPDGTATELELTRWVIGADEHKEWRRPDGSLAASC